MDHVKVVSADTNEIAGEYESSESMPEIITITDAQKVKIETSEAASRKRRNSSSLWQTFMAAPETD